MQSISLAKAVSYKFVDFSLLGILLGFPLASFVIFVRIKHHFAAESKIHSDKFTAQILYWMSQGKNTQQIETALLAQQQDDSVGVNFVPVFNRPLNAWAGLPLNDFERKLLNETLETQEIQQGLKLLEGRFYQSQILHFQQECLVCHQGVNSREVAAVFILHTSIANTHIPMFSLFFYIPFFLLLVMGLAYWMFIKWLKDNLLQPMNKLSKQIKDVRQSNEAHQWQPTLVNELDQLQQAYAHSLDRLTHNFSMMDQLAVTHRQTGLFHRSRFIEAMQYEIHRSTRYHHQFCLVVVRIYHIKTLQLTFAEQDRDFLSQLGQTLQEKTRATDTLFPISERDIAIITPETNDDSPPHILTRINAALKCIEVAPNEILNLDYAIGLSQFPQDGDSARTLIENAIAQFANAPTSF